MHSTDIDGQVLDYIGCFLVVNIMQNYKTNCFTVKEVYG